MSEELISIKALHKTFRDFWRRPVVEAVRGIDFAVRAGEVYGLLGPNGSGKSTTLKMILGLLRPSAGTVRVFGKEPTDVQAKARIGYLPEVSRLHDFLTPRETLLYYASLFGIPRRTAKERTGELLEMVGLSEAADRPVGRFSKGMARRVGIAQALVNAPELLILDEPTSGLDPIGTREVKDWVRILAKNGVTVLMTSHLLADVEDVCDRVAILDRGRLRAEGEIRTLLREPDIVRFSIEGLSGAEAESLKKRIEAAAGRPVRQDYPAMSLEAYFLNVVSPDEQEQVMKVAPFLRGRANGGAR